jgi:glycosyltransferase involved in cell wall biosynthesis
VRILYLADIRFPLERANGIQSIETCHALARRGHDVHMIVRPDTSDPPRDPYPFYGVPRVEHLGIERAPVAGPALARRLGYLAFALGRTLGGDRPDVVLTRDLGVAAFMLRLPAALRPRLVYESHGYAPAVTEALPSLIATATPASPRKLRRLAANEAIVWQRADGYVTITRALGESLVARFGARPHLETIPDGVRGDAITPVTAHDPRPPAGRPVVAYAGHLYAWKGVDVLLEAIARVPEVDGLIVGGHDKEPDLARVKGSADRLGISGRVTFSGLVPPADVSSLLSRADVLVLPNPPSAISSQFTSPLKLFEYMAAGRPIVASDLPSIREILTSGVDSLLVTPGDAEALAAGIRAIVSDRSLGERLATAAALAVRDYTWDRRAERYDALLRQVLGEAGARA